MRHQGSEAYRVETAERSHERRRQGTPDLEVLAGGGLDALRRRGLAPHTVSVARLIALAVAAVCALGIVAVCLSTAATVTMAHNEQLRSDLVRAEDVCGDLRSQCAALEAGAHVSRVATKDLGMELPDQRVSVTVDPTAGGDGVSAAAPAGAPGDLS